AGVEPAEAADLFDHERRIARWNCQPEADRTGLPPRRDEGPVYPDDFPLEVEHRAAGIAVINGGVRLDIVVDGRRLEVAVERADDTDADRVRQPLGIPDHDDRVA